MDVILYLTTLLQTRKTVGIVGLGSLYKIKIPGKYDANQRAFVPPSYSLAFSNEILENEELINFIAQERGLSSAAATLYIDRFVAQVKAQLASAQKVELANLGTLSLVEDEISFVPNGENVDHSFFGLPEVAEKREPINTNKEAQEVTYAVPEEEALETEIEVETPKRGLSVALKVLLLLLFMAILAAIAYVVNPSILDGLQKNTEPQELKANPVVTNDSLQADTSKQQTEAITPSAAQLNDTLKIDSVTVYQVIGTAEKSQSRIDHFIQQMKKRGITAQALPKLPGKSKINVSLGAFTDYNLAKKKQDSLRKQLKNSEIYILPITPKK